MILLWIVMTIYTALGFVIISPESDEAKEYFSSFATALWNMLMIINGADWPGTIIPAYHENRLYIIYFGIFVVLLSWGLGKL